MTERARAQNESAGATQARVDYYANERPEVANLVPGSARFVLDVGCGAGGLGRALKSMRPGIQVRGIEIVSEQAMLARAVLDDVFIGSADDPMPPDWPMPDCIVFADVLEHLVDPWSTLRSFRTRLAPGGTIVISLPNVAHWSVVRDLLAGRWEYRDAGLLDRTHLRFFTTRSAIELVEQAGFRVEQLQRIVDGGSLLSRQVRNVQKPSGPSRLRDMFWEPLTFQILMVAS